MTPAELWDERLYRAGVKLGSRPGRHAGGEWDAWRALTSRQRRTIIGLGWAGPRGMAPDQAVHALGETMTPDELVAELVRAARTAHRWRHQRQAQRRQARARRLLGPQATYHALREWQAREAGHGSYRALRRARGWAG